jgi:acetyl-CoA carboxylase biotin carboxyl carrier protein
MNLKEIKEMISLMNENELVELEVEREGSKIKIKKSSTDLQPHIIRPIPEYRIESQAPSGKTTEQTLTPSSDKKNKIASPMVGTFYRAPSPEAPPFADVGQVVEVGQVVCIVEAMKLMNEIKSEIRGKIVEVLAQNAEPVEFGQALFVVEPV